MNKTPEQYAEDNGTRCPCCGGAQLSGGFVEIEAGAASQGISCDDCGAEWTDTYVLTGYRNLEANK